MLAEVAREEQPVLAIRARARRKRSSDTPRSALVDHNVREGRGGGRAVMRREAAEHTRPGQEPLGTEAGAGRVKIGHKAARCLAPRRERRPGRGVSA